MGFKDDEYILYLKDLIDDIHDDNNLLKNLVHSINIKAQEIKDRREDPDAYNANREGIKEWEKLWDKKSNEFKQMLIDFKRTIQKNYNILR